LEDLQVDASTFGRMTCCGKAMHDHCTERFFGSSLSQEQKSKCPQCQVKLVSTDEETFELTRGWADKGKAWAQAFVGNKYRHGQGIEQSNEKAIEYYTLAIQQSDPNAMFGLALMYHQGQGVTKSIKKCIELYTQTADQGHASAQYNLGYCYRYGEGVVQSTELAREWWIKAAVQDQKQALQHLQILDKYEGRTTPTILCCSTCGKPKTPLRPLKPCKLCHTVQYCGRECQVNHWKKGGHRKKCKTWRKAAAAAVLLEKAVEQGDPGAMARLAGVYENGEGVVQSFKRAFGLWTMAAEKGDVDSMYTLGALYFRGQGVDQSNELARDWWTKAANEGNETAAFQLARLYADGKKVAQSYQKAIELYTMAAEKNNTNAMFSLGFMHYHGNGVAQSYETACEWWKKRSRTRTCRCCVSISSSVRGWKTRDTIVPTSH
jgi:TPR repeat protein